MYDLSLFAIILKLFLRGCHLLLLPPQKHKCDEAKFMYTTTRKRRSQPISFSPNCLQEIGESNNHGSSTISQANCTDVCGSQKLPHQVDDLLVLPNFEISPEIPRQDSIKFTKKKPYLEAPQNLVKRKSLRLHLKRLKNDELPDATTSNIPQSMNTNKHCYDQYESDVPSRAHMNTGAKSSKKIRTKENTIQPQLVKGTVDTKKVRHHSTVKGTVDMRKVRRHYAGVEETSHYIQPPMKKRKTLVGNCKFGVFKLSVVDDKVRSLHMAII